MVERTIAIIQARMGSSRFPGKMTASFLGRPVLSWVIQRIKRATQLDGIILATTSLERDRVLLDLAHEHDIDTYAGDEQDVLGRFVEAAKKMHADVVVRICADNPLIAPEAVDQVIKFYRTHQPDYAYNHVPKGACDHPDGFGAEIIKTQLLEEISQRTSEPSHREHVTSYIWEHPSKFRIDCPPCPDDWRLPEYATFDIDHPGDIPRLEQALHDIRPASPIHEVMKAWNDTKRLGQST